MLQAMECHSKLDSKMGRWSRLAVDQHRLDVELGR